MSAVDIVMGMFSAMNMDEKKEVVLRVGEDPDVVGMVADVKSSAKKTSGKRGGGKPRSPYWIRTVTGIDESAKGFAMFEGDWVNDPADMKSGELCMIGTREDPKQYILCKANHSEEVSFEVWGKTMTVDGVSRIDSAGKMSALLEEVQRLL